MPRPGFTRRSRRPTVLASATATDRSIIFMVSISHRPGGRDRKTRAHRAARSRNCVYEHDGATLSLVIARLAPFPEISSGHENHGPRPIPVHHRTRPTTISHAPVTQTDLPPHPPLP